VWPGSGISLTPSAISLSFISHRLNAVRITFKNMGLPLPIGALVTPVQGGIGLKAHFNSSWEQMNWAVREFFHIPHMVPMEMREGRR